MNQEKIGKFIARLRKEKGLTQAQLAEHFDISNKAVSKWENGKSLKISQVYQWFILLFSVIHYYGIEERRVIYGSGKNW